MYGTSGFLAGLLPSKFLFFFFFSSRRRHTRYIGDWSSDVCSSDLSGHCFLQSGRADWGARLSPRDFGRYMNWRQLGEKRSEERRVGKECRSRWWTYEEKKNRERYGSGRRASKYRETNGDRRERFET